LSVDDGARREEDAPRLLPLALEGVEDMGEPFHVDAPVGLVVQAIGRRHVDDTLQAAREVPKCPGIREVGCQGVHAGRQALWVAP